MNRALQYLSSVHSKLVYPLLLLVASPALVGQNNADRSPYSRYGYGSLSPTATAAARAMGGVGIGLRDRVIINPQNPASYTAVDSQTFILDFAVSARSAILSQGKEHDSRLLANLDYATILMPLVKGMGLSMGIMPWATTGYQFGTIAPIGGDDNSKTYKSSYSGRGSFNSLYLGVAAKPIGGFSLGVNGAFLFGSSTHDRSVIYADEGAINPVFSDVLRLKGFRVDAGVQYEWGLGSRRDRSVVLGATFSPKVSFKSEAVNIRYTGVTGSSAVYQIQNDTAKLTGDYTLPSTLGVGLSYRIQDKLLLGADVKYLSWSSARYQGMDMIGRFADQYRVSLGGEWIPKSRSRKFYNRLHYRFGLSGGNSYVEMKDDLGSYSNYSEYGATLGVGLPLVDLRSMLNLSFEYKYLHPKGSSMLKEHHFGITLGLTFNEAWFRKARVY